jgi:protein-disulfide isomerase
VNQFRAQQVVNVSPGDGVRQGVQGDNPPIRIIEFADFQCPACGFAHKFMTENLKKHGNKFQLIFRNFPLDSDCNPGVQVHMHPWACLAARAAFCARKQGKWQQMYDKLFENQRQLSRENILAWAGELGLDTKKIEDCIPSEEATASLKADVDEGAKSGLESTPTFFVNGRMVKGAIDEKRLVLLMHELGVH